MEGYLLLELFLSLCKGKASNFTTQSASKWTMGLGFFSSAAVNLIRSVCGYHAWIDLLGVGGEIFSGLNPIRGY